MIVTLIEKRDNSHEIRYSEQPVQQNYFIREWKYKSITEEQLEEVKNATTDKVESIISKLYNENNPPLVP